LTGSSVDICKNELPEEWGRFDIIISFCVIEHMEKQGQLKALKSMAGALSPGGMMALTFDYGEGAKAVGSLRNLDEVKQLIRTTGLSTEGNSEFIDKKTRFMLGHRERANYTFGSLFIRK
jgi:cyclopropane fatty-acyl-phospholipid synthase-like methyltransferase